MLTIRLIGQFQLTRDNKPVALNSRPAQSLLAYLLIHAGKPARREMLAGMLWPESTESDARNNLRQALWRIRQSIESHLNDDYLIVSDLTIQFNLESEYDLDVDALTDRLDQNASIDELVRALSVYTGELLPGFYDDWIVLVREQLYVDFERKMRLLLDKLESDRRWGEVMTWAERWIGLGAAPEPAYRSLMLAYAAQDDLAGMAMAFRRCERTMQDVLGLDPSEATRMLYQRLKARELSALPPPVAPVQDPVANQPETPAPGASPYKGLQAFEASDAEFFFGRGEAVEEMISRIQGGTRFLAIVGASGSGKSSVVRAGLLPALQSPDGGSRLQGGQTPGVRSWDAVLFTPGEYPLDGLARALQEGSPPVKSEYTSYQSLKRNAAGVVEWLRERRNSNAAAGSPGFLLVVDQFEELFTLCKDENERVHFIEALSSLTEAEDLDDMAVAITLRSDFYAHCGEYPHLRELLAENQIYLGRMNARELRQVIEAPAGVGGWLLQPGLADLILRDISRQPGALPLLSHALRETWLRRQGRTLTIEGYARTGGVRGAIARTAEIVYNRDFSTEQQRIARNIFIRLTELGEGGETTRRRVQPTELVPAEGDQAIVQSVLNLLVEARLITSGENTIEIAHEALISEWPTLYNWLAEDRTEILMHRRLTDAALAWEAFDRSPSELYRGARLTQTEEWLEARHPDLSQLEQEFLQASSDLAAELEAQRRSREERELRAALELAQAQQQKAEAEQELIESQSRALAQLRRRAVILTLALMFALSMAGIALFLGERVRQIANTAQQNADRAEMESRIAFSRELAAAAVANIDRDSDLSILLALEAVEFAQQAGVGVPREAIEALHQTVSAARLRFSFPGGFNVAFSPDGGRIAHSAPGGVVSIRYFPGGPEQQIVTGHQGDSFGVNVVFDSGGRWLMTASADGTAKIWDPVSGGLVYTLEKHAASITDAALSPDGRWAATTGNDGFLRIWDLNTGDLHFGQEIDGISGVTFDPESRYVAFGRDLVASGQITILDLVSGAQLLEIAGHALGTADVIFDLDGERLFSVGFDGEINVWDVNSGDLLDKLDDLPPVYSLSLNSDGTQLVVGAVSGEAIVWEFPDLDLLYRFPSHRDVVSGVAFSPDGRYLATSGIDGFTRVWDISKEGDSELLGLAGHHDLVYSVDYSPDGSLLASSSWDRQVMIWDADSGVRLQTLVGFDEGVARVHFSPDGSRVVTAEYSGRLGVWDASTGRQIASWEAHPPGDIDVAFNANGSILGSAGADGLGRLWDSRNGTLLTTLEGHADAVYRVAFSLDGQEFATASLDGTARIWDVEKGALLHTIAADAGEVRNVDFSPDGRFFVTAHADGAARIWNLEDSDTMLPYRVLIGHSSVVWDAAFHPDGSSLATIGFDGTVRFWDVETGDEILVLAGAHNGPDLEFSPDGRQLAVTSGDGVIRIFVLALDDLVQVALSRLTRGFTEQECIRYLHVEEGCP